MNRKLKIKLTISSLILLACHILIRAIDNTNDMKNKNRNKKIKRENKLKKDNIVALAANQTYNTRNLKIH